MRFFVECAGWRGLKQKDMKTAANDSVFAQVVKWGAELLSLFFLVVTLLPLLKLAELPRRIPCHYNIFGEADRWGAPSRVWIFPVMGFVFYFLLGFLQLNPRYCTFGVQVTDANRERIYALAVEMLRLLKMELCAIFAYGAFQIVANQPSLSPWVMYGLLLLMLVTLLVALVRIRSVS